MRIRSQCDWPELSQVRLRVISFYHRNLFPYHALRTIEKGISNEASIDIEEISENVRKGPGNEQCIDSGETPPYLDDDWWQS